MTADGRTVPDKHSRTTVDVELRATQLQVLRSILSAGAAGRYGELHKFPAITGDAEYARLPFMSYDQVAGFDAYWDDPENFSSDRLIAYFLTSGSSSEPKKIPVTSSLVREKARAFSQFWQSIYAAHPALKNGYFIANFADSGHSGRNDKGILETSETTFWNQRMQGFQDTSRWPAGKYLTAIESAELRYYAAARLALQGPLHCMMSLNPSTLVKFCQTIEEHSASLAQGLQDRTWGIDSLDSDANLPPQLVEALQGNRAAADTLTKACAVDGGKFQLQEIWSDLELIICWQSGLVEPYLRLLRRYSGSIDFRDYITQSSECVIAIPTQDNVSGGTLAHECHYFEFIPEEQVNAETPVAIPAWETETGRNYEVVVTTGGGLYRYRTGDCISVAGFAGDVPIISFQYRTGRTSSITGEKLTEQQVMTAIRQASSAHTLDTTDIIVYPRTGEQPHYAVMIPDAASLETPVDELLHNWIRTYDLALNAANREYEDKRASARLGVPRLLVVTRSDFLALQRKFRAAHVGDDQYKPGVLRKERDLDAGLEIVKESCAHR